MCRGRSNSLSVCEVKTWKNVLQVQSVLSAFPRTVQVEEWSTQVSTTRSAWSTTGTTSITQTGGGSHLYSTVCSIIICRSPVHAQHVSICPLPRRDGVIAVSKHSSQFTDEYLPDQRSHLYGITIATTSCLSGEICVLNTHTLTLRLWGELIASCAVMSLHQSVPTRCHFTPEGYIYPETVSVSLTQAFGSVALTLVLSLIRRTWSLLCFI